MFRRNRAICALKDKTRNRKTTYSMKLVGKYHMSNDIYERSNTTKLHKMKSLFLLIGLSLQNNVTIVKDECP